MPSPGHNIATAYTTQHIVSEQFQLPAQDLQKTTTVKKQSLTGEGFMGPYFSLLDNCLQWILGESHCYCPGSNRQY